MEQQNLTLTRIIADALNHLRQQNYSKSTIIRYRCIWNQLIKYAKAHEIRIYTISYGIEFITQHYGADLTGIISQHHLWLLRTIRILYEMQEYGFINVKPYVKPVKKPVHFLKILKEYSEHLKECNLSQKTIRRKEDLARKFFLFVEEKYLLDLSVLTAKTVYDFLETRKSLAVSSKEMELYVLRDLIRFLVSKQKCKQELAKLFPVISVHSKDSIPSFFTTHEIKKILECVDRKSKMGKRDYALLLLAVQLGMRAGDIRDLKMGDIKWTKNCIEFTQGKNGKFISLPLPHETLLALLDYIKNSRPHSEKPFVFIKAIAAPYTDYGDNPFYTLVQKYLKAANIEYKKSKHHGLHSLRHSLAGNMLLDGAPMPVITNILGHRYADTTTKYLKIDIPQLRQVALEVPYDSKG